MTATSVCSLQYNAIVGCTFSKHSAKLNDLRLMPPFCDALGNSGGDSQESPCESIFLLLVSPQYIFEHMQFPIYWPLL